MTRSCNPSQQSHACRDHLIRSDNRRDALKYAGLAGLCAVATTFSSAAATAASIADLGCRDTTETCQRRFARGIEVLRKIGGEAFDVPISRVAEISPDFARLIAEYPYGEVISRPGLDLQLRQITTISALIAEGSAQPQLKFHANGFLNVGGEPRQLVELLFVAAAVLGFPASIDALGIFREIFNERKIAFTALAPMTDDGTGRYRRGLDALSKLAPADASQIIGPLEAVSPELARWTIEFAYGDLLFRDGLGARAKQIAIISMLSTVGNRETALLFNVKGALNQGVKREEIIEVLIQLSVYAGFPAALNAFFVAANAFRELERSPVSAPVAIADDGISSEGRSQRLDRGLATLRKTSAAAGIAVVNAFNDVAPDLGRLILEHSYGDIFSRTGLDPKTRELAACSAMAAVATTAVTVPFRVHVNAALTAGAKPAELIETLLNLIPYCGYPAVQRAVEIAAEEMAKREHQ